MAVNVSSLYDWVSFKRPMQLGITFCTLPILFGLMVVKCHADYNYWFVPIYCLLSYLGINTRMNAVKQTDSTVN